MKKRGHEAWITAAGVLALGVLAGMGIRRWIEPARVPQGTEALRPQGHEAPGMLDVETDLALALRELRLALDSLRSQLEQGVLPRRVEAFEDAQRQGGAAVEVEAASLEASASTDLARSIDALSAALLARPVEGIAGSAGTRWTRGEVGPPLEAFETAELRHAYRLDRKGDATYNAHRAFERSLLLTSKAEVLDRFGLPDAIYVSDGTSQWSYETSMTDGEEEVVFYFDDGAVYRVSYDWDDFD